VRAPTLSIRVEEEEKEEAAKRWGRNPPALHTGKLIPASHQRFFMMTHLKLKRGEPSVPCFIYPFQLVPTFRERTQSQGKKSHQGKKTWENWMGVREVGCSRF
jgi:hypothetical protein